MLHAVLDHQRVISIHAPRAGSDHLPFRSINAYNISIHAPRAGSDFSVNYARARSGISIHAPRAGSDSRNAQNNRVFLQRLFSFWEIV